TAAPQCGNSGTLTTESAESTDKCLPPPADLFYPLHALSFRAITWAMNPSDKGAAHDDVLHQ
ncbi:MAG: hypothetical protein ACYCZF_16735, partial [Anaerolineae bacterium]